MPATASSGQGETMADKRPSWDEYFMGIAFQVATRSTCDRAHVGAVIVRERRILTTGYNGSPRGLPHCDDVGHLMVDGHCVRTLHAEQNAIIQAAYHGISVKGGTIYVTHQPCLTCAKMIINAGLVRVVYAGEYPDPYSTQFLLEAGVTLQHFPWPPEGKETPPVPVPPETAPAPRPSLFSYPLEEGAWVRLLRYEDAEAVARTVNQNRTHLRRWLAWVDGSRTVEDSRKFIASALQAMADDRGITLAIWVEGELAGLADLRIILRDNRGEIGYWLAEKFQGRGLITRTVSLLLDYGFSEKRLHRIAIVAATGNARSRAIPERLGFHHDGTLRGYSKLYDRYLDMEVYSVLRDEWVTPAQRR